MADSTWKQDQEHVDDTGSRNELSMFYKGKASQSGVHKHGTSRISIHQASNTMLVGARNYKDREYKRVLQNKAAKANREHIYKSFDTKMPTGAKPQSIVPQKDPQRGQQGNTVTLPPLTLKYSENATRRSVAPGSLYRTKIEQLTKIMQQRKNLESVGRLDVMDQSTSRPSLANLKRYQSIVEMANNTSKSRLSVGRYANKSQLNQKSEYYIGKLKSIQSSHQKS